MANKTIAELTAGTTMDGTELLHGVQGGNSRKFTGLQILTQSLSASNQAAARAAISAALVGHINGLSLSTNATDATNDIDIAAGEAASGQASPILMVYTGATGRQIDVAYGTGSGARFDSSVSDGNWYIFLISNGTTVGIGLSKSADPTGQANYPSGYTHYRIIGYLVRASSTNKAPVMLTKPVMEVVGTAPIFGVRAWVNFDGSTGAIRASGNVSSVTRNGAGDYTLNFPVALPDANYAIAGSGNSFSLSNSQATVNLATTATTGGPVTKTTTAVRIIVAFASSGAPLDLSNVTVIMVG